MSFIATMQLTKITAMKQPEVDELIRSLRHELELTRQQLSVELGTVTSTINRWENGHSQPYLFVDGDRRSYCNS